MTLCDSFWDCLAVKNVKRQKFQQNMNLSHFNFKLASSCKALDLKREVRNRVQAMNTPVAVFLRLRSARKKQKKAFVSFCNCLFIAFLESPPIDMPE